MKNKIKNCLATTALSLIILSSAALFYDARFLCISTVFEAAAANLVIHGGLELVKRVESSFFIVEVTLEIGYILAVLMLFGRLFAWFQSTPPWLLALIGILVYIGGCAIDTFHIRSDINVINKQLKLINSLRKEQP